MRRPAIFATFLLFIGLGAYLTQDQWAWYLEDDEVVAEEIVAPQLEAEVEEGDRLYRIDPNQSSASYRVGEKLAGQDRGEAVGTTTALGGDVLIPKDNVAGTTIGTIVINLEVLESDNKLRDKRIRHDFLESSHYKFAEFETTNIDGLPDEIEEGADYPITITGDLTVKDITNEEVFEGTVSLDGDALTAEMTSNILLSTYDAGPISVMALVTTEDEAELSLNLVAVEERAATEEPRDPATRLISQPEFNQSDDSNFSTAVLPVIENRCASCHVEGGIGYATLGLETVGDVAAVADGIGVVTSNGYMPPWPASDESAAFKHDWSLDADEIAALTAWADGGGEIDIDPTTPLQPATELRAQIDEDMVLRQAEPYVGDPSIKDDYRCQIVDPELTEESWLRGYDFYPENEEVHHVIVFVGDAESRIEADQKDGEDGRPGWNCYGLSNIGTGQVRSFGGWVPGQVPTVYPEGYGRKMNAGDYLIVQTHFHYDHEAPADDSPMVLDFYEGDETEGLASISGGTYITPVEIPCYEADQDLPACDRDVELKRILEAFGPLGPGIPLTTNRRCGVTAEDFAHMNQGTASSSCDIEVGRNGTIYAVLGHMHELGASYRMTLNPDTPEERILLDIPRWTFEWQLSYQLDEEIRVTETDIVRFECAWDRSLQPTWEPKYVIWAEGTQDEMCYSTIGILSDK